MSKASAASVFEHTDTEAAVVFVDMSGFSALTEVHGDHLAAQLAEAFAAMAMISLGPDDELIKTIGGAVMVTCGNASTALAFLRRLNEATELAEGFPMLRAGVSAGPVVKRRGDVYRATVNTAARLAALAAPGQIVTTRDVAAAALGSELSIESLGPVQLRNMSEPIELFAVDAASARREHMDPVCRMHVAAVAAATAVTHRGRLYRFCSTFCAKRFGGRPDDFTE
jgi:adenylate cyclase